MSNTNSDRTPKSFIDSSSKPRPQTAAQDDKRVDIATADDVNVDEDNAIESPKNSLTATESNDAQDKGVTTNPNKKNPGDEVTPDAKQTGEVPCERCEGTGQRDGKPCGQCGGTGEVVVTVGDA